MLEHGILFEILTYETFKKSRAASVSNFGDYVKWGRVPITLKNAINIYLPGSTLINCFILAKDLLRLSRSGNYEFIHARADYTAFLCAILRPFHKLPVVWDCRGDAVDELKFSIEKYSWFARKILGTLLVPRQRFIRYAAARFSIRSICVSRVLRRLANSTNPALRSFEIPCPVPTNRFYFNPEKRLAARQRFQISGDEILFIYSGSMTGYQAIDQFIWYYKKILSLPNTRVLVATIDKVAASRLLDDIKSDRLIITSVKYDDMNELYCAADFAIMMRAPRPLNQVASPTKFGEYCLTGLPVIHNSSIDQVTQFTRELGNGLSLEVWPPERIGNDQRFQIAQHSKKFYGRENLNTIYIECYNGLQKVSSF